MNRVGYAILFVLIHSSRSDGLVVVGPASKGKPTCAPLTNHGTHFTVDVAVGTPEQVFSVVADTGSNSLIIPSCICAQKGACEKDMHCFTGSNKSSTFSLKQGPEGPNQMLLSFGSGNIEAVLVTDVVKVGSMAVNMKDGVLLMVDNQLRISGPFEGILGLGVPGASKLFEGPEDEEKKQVATEEVEKPDSTWDYIKETLGFRALLQTDANETPFDSSFSPAFGFGGGDDHGISVDGSPVDMSPFVRALKDLARESMPVPMKMQQQPAGFLEESGAESFSMCFNEESKGTLRIGPPAAKGLGNVGKMHWGLGLTGISVGKKDHADEATPIAHCTEENMTNKDQFSPCGAIPDSGTTSIMGPKEQIVAVFEQLCDDWDRCRKNHTALLAAAEAAKKAATEDYGFNPFQIKVKSKSEIFESLLKNCEEWISEGEGLYELPSLFFKMKGAEGHEQTVELTGWSYVVEAIDEEKKYVYKHVEGLGDIPIGIKKTGVKRRTCSPGFGEMDYNTRSNGPVWIIGTPLFYEYSVGFGMQDKAHHISFTSLRSQPCNACGREKASLVSESDAIHEADALRARRARKPRQVQGPWRVPNINTGLPM